MKILFFAPHPDDLEFFVGGTAIWHCEKGNQTIEILLTRGENEWWNPRKGQQLAAIREAEAKKAARILGIDRWRFLDFVDGRITFDEKSVRKISAVLEEFRPDIVYAPEYKIALDFWDSDHLQTGKIVREACRRAKGGVKLFFYQSFLVDTFVDITAYYDKRKRALNAYASQRLFLNIYKPLYLLFLLFWGWKAKGRWGEGVREWEGRLELSPH